MPTPTCRVILLDVYSKDSQANLTKAERNELRAILTDLPQVWREARRGREYGWSQEMSKAGSRILQGVARSAGLCSDRRRKHSGLCGACSPRPSMSGRFANGSASPRPRSPRATAFQSAACAIGSRARSPIDASIANPLTVLDKEPEAVSGRSTPPDPSEKHPNLTALAQHSAEV